MSKILLYLLLFAIAVEVLGSWYYLPHSLSHKKGRSHSAKIMGQRCHVIYRFLSFHSISLSLYIRAFSQRVNDTLQIYSPVHF